jgi:hypothetical protein
MKYKCIKKYFLEDVKLMSPGDIIVFNNDDNNLRNITTGTTYSSLHDINKIKECLEPITDEFSIYNTFETDSFKLITDKLHDTYTRKNHDYGNSFDQSLDKFGLIAAVVRLGDKMNRIEKLSTSEAQVSGESIKDTLLDMANYAIMTVMWMNNK